MTVFGICFEWLITFIEITLGHYFMSILFEEQYLVVKDEALMQMVVPHQKCNACLKYMSNLDKKCYI